MSIEREGKNEFTLCCDRCPATLGPYDFFDEAVEARKAHGWKAVRIQGEWEDRCPDCINTTSTKTKNGKIHINFGGID